MANIIISLSAAQVTRVRNALQVTSSSEVAVILKSYLKSQVLNAEKMSERDKADITAHATITDEGW
jgi:hypothetical protein